MGIVYRRADRVYGRAMHMTPKSDTRLLLTASQNGGQLPGSMQPPLLAGAFYSTATGCASVSFDGGKWWVETPSGQRIAARGNADAWRIADKINREPVSRQEALADWIASRTDN